MEHPLPLPDHPPALHAGRLDLGAAQLPPWSRADRAERLPALAEMLRSGEPAAEIIALCQSSGALSPMED